MLQRKHWPDKTPAAWLAEVRSKVAENVAKFEAEEKWNEFAKWSWFANTLEEEIRIALRGKGMPMYV
jgi:hypothetical protein